MKIECDHCGHPVEESEALVRELQDGELLYFCSEACRAEGADLYELFPADEETFGDGRLGV